MQADIQADIDSINSAITLLKQHVEFDSAYQRLSDFESQITSDGFWDNQAHAQKVMQDKTHLENQLAIIKALEEGVRDQTDMIALAEEEQDNELAEDAKSALSELRKLAEKSSLNLCSLVRQMAITVLSRFTPAQVVLKLRTGQRCCCGCIPDGQRRAASSWKP